MKLRDSKLSSSQASAAHFQVGLMPPDIPKNPHGTSEYHVDMWLYMSQKEFACIYIYICILFYVFYILINLFILCLCNLLFYYICICLCIYIYILEGT
jgi:hypothetical protein